MSSLPFSLGQSANRFGGTLAEKFQNWTNQMRKGVAQVGDAYSEGSFGGLPVKPINEGFNAFQAGLTGDAIPGEDIELRQDSLLPKGAPLAIESHMAQNVPPVAPEPNSASLSDSLFGMTQDGNNVPQFRQAPPEPSRVNVTVDGKTYDYADGRSGGAPTLGGIGRGLGKQWGTEPSDQTLEYSQPGIGHGSYSQLTDNPQMASLGQLQDDRALADARPTGDPLGYTRGDMRGLDATLRARMADEHARGMAQIELAHEKAAIEQADEKRVMGELAPLQSDDFAETEQMKADPRFLSASPEDQAKMLATLTAAQEARNARAGRYKENLALARGKVNTTFAPNAPGNYRP